MSPRKLIVAKKNIAVARLVLRERRPPPPKISVQLRPQHLRWEVGKYRDRIRSGPGGLGRAKIWTPERVGEQHNLVLDAASDLIGLNGLRNLAFYAAVGTGSQAPATTDTALVAEVAFTSNRPAGWSDQLGQVSQGVYQIQVQREFLAADVGGQNLAEWGFRPGQTGNLLVRELFRDSNGTPVVLSLAADQNLRLVYSYQITLAPISQAVSIGITNIGTVTGVIGLIGGNAGQGYDFNSINAVLTNSSYFRGSTFNSAQSPSYTTSLGSPAYQGSWTGIPTIDPYVSGSRQKTFTFNLDVNDSNFTIYGFAFSSSTYDPFGFYLVLDQGSEISKDNLHKLILDPWTITW